MVSIPVEFYLLAVGALDNRLAMNLLWETVRYLRFPYLTNGMETLTGRKELAGFSREETIEALRAEAAHSYGRSLQALFAFMDEMSWTRAKGCRANSIPLEHLQAKAPASLLLCLPAHPGRF